MICRCHSSDLYRGLVKCPACGHQSFDRLADSCERRRCGYVAPIVLDEAATARLDEIMATHAGPLPEPSLPLEWGQA